MDNGASAKAIPASTEATTKRPSALPVRGRCRIRSSCTRAVVDPRRPTRVVMARLSAKPASPARMAGTPPSLAMSARDVPPMSPVTMGKLAEGFAVLQTLEERYGSASVALHQLDALEQTQHELMDTIALLKKKLRTAHAQADRARFDADAFVKHVWRNFACRGDMSLLLQLIKHFQEHDGRPMSPFLDGNLLLSVQPIADVPVSATTSLMNSPTRDGDADATTQVQVASLTPKAKSSSSGGSSSSSATGSKRRRSMSPSSKLDKRRRGATDQAVASEARPKKPRAPPEDVPVIQNLQLPTERRNVAEMKHSSQYVSFAVLEAIDRQEPWEHVYRNRPLYSHILNYDELNDAARAWFVSVLQVQYQWRREFWERLHWLPMSENVLPGPRWDKTRQTRKKRASVAVAAWRKVYNESIELIKAGALPKDVWCDPSLWYMPQSPLYWLPQTNDVMSEQHQLDDRQPVRAYYVYDINQHPFYKDGLATQYPHKYDLPLHEVMGLARPLTWEARPANAPREPREPARNARVSSQEHQDGNEDEDRKTSPTLPSVQGTAARSRSGIQSGTENVVARATVDDVVMADGKAPDTTMEAEVQDKETGVPSSKPISGSEAASIPARNEAREDGSIAKTRHQKPKADDTGRDQDTAATGSCGIQDDTEQTG